MKFAFVALTIVAASSVWAQSDANVEGVYHGVEYNGDGTRHKETDRSIAEINDHIDIYLLPKHLMLTRIAIPQARKPGYSKIVSFYGKWSRKGDTIFVETLASNAGKFKKPTTGTYRLASDWLSFSSAGDVHFVFRLVRRK